MSILAIAKIQNSEEVTVEKGWKYGYRLIDTVDKKTLDVSYAVILEGYERHRMRVTNIKYYFDGFEADRGWAADDSMVEIPTILVSKDGERVISADAKGRDLVFVTNIYVRPGHPDMYTVCDCSGKNIRLVVAESVSQRYMQGKTVVMNSIVRKSGGKTKISVTGLVEEEEPDWNLVRHKQANEYMARSRIIGAPMMWMCDIEGSTGVYLDSVDRRMSGDLYVPDYVEEIGLGAFISCDGFENIALGKSVREINQLAFAAVSVNSILLNRGLRCIYNEAFTGAWIVQPLVIPENVEGIYPGAFGALHCPELVIKSGSLNTRVVGFDWAGGLRDNIQRLTLCEDAAVKILHYYSSNNEEARKYIDVYNLANRDNKLKSTRAEASDQIAKLLHIFDSRFKDGVRIID